MVLPFCNSPLGKLPFELLEDIFLEVVREDDCLTSTKHLAQEESIKIHIEQLEAVSASLAFRTTCTTFRNLSWRALAEKINRTTFDLRSQDSIEALIAISKKVELALWITQLNIACHTTCKKYPFSRERSQKPEDLNTSLSQSALADLLEVKKKEREWYPDTWFTFSTHMQNKGGPKLSSSRLQSGSDVFDKVLAKHLATFKKIEHVSYIYADTVPPGRYKQLFKRYPEWQSQKSLSLHLSSDTGSGLNAHLGLETILNTCFISGIRPQALDLAVDLDEHHAFITGMDEQTLGEVCSKVEKLCLVDSYCPFYDINGMQAAHPRIVLTRKLFPVLRILTIDHSTMMLEEYDRVAPLPSLAEIPTLSHLAILGAYLDEPTLLSFLSCYGKNVENVTLKGSSEYSYRGVLEILNQGHLKRLEIIHEDDAYWEQYFNDLVKGTVEDDLANLMRNVYESPFMDVAKEVVLRPSGFAKAVEAYRSSHNCIESESKE
jgi:hypothetical protein